MHQATQNRTEAHNSKQRTHFQGLSMVKTIMKAGNRHTIPANLRVFISGMNIELVLGPHGSNTICTTKLI